MLREAKLPSNRISHRILTRPKTILGKCGAPIFVRNLRVDGVFHSVEKQLQLVGIQSTLDVIQLICVAQVSLITTKAMCVQHLEQPSHPSSNYKNPDLVTGACVEHSNSDVTLERIQHQQRLPLMRKGRQCLMNQAQNLQASIGVHPSTLTTQEYNVIAEVRLQRSVHLSGQRPFIANHDLRQTLLYQWVVAYQSHMREVSSTCRMRYALDRIVASSQKDVTFLVTLVQTNCGLVPVDVKQCFPRWPLGAIVIVPLPHRCSFGTQFVRAELTRNRQLAEPTIIFAPQSRHAHL